MRSFGDDHGACWGNESSEGIGLTQSVFLSKDARLFWLRSRWFGALLLNVLSDDGFEKEKGDSPLAQDHVVKTAKIEAFSQFGFGELAEFANFEFADFVGDGLARPCDVAVDLGGDVVKGESGAGSHVLNRFFATPPHGVDAGIDDKTTSPPHLVGKAPKIAVGVAIKAHF